MAYMSVIGPCYGCGRVFSFNADWVPSVIVNGQREPICLACVERANPLRIASGLEPIKPHPDAYEPQEVP
jgi:hypothetical protein